MDFIITVKAFCCYLAAIQSSLAISRRCCLWEKIYKGNNKCRQSFSLYYGKTITRSPSSMIVGIDSVPVMYGSVFLSIGSSSSTRESKGAMRWSLLQHRSYIEPYFLFFPLFFLRNRRWATQLNKMGLLPL